ncbi:MAG: hypothetical protein R2867_14275 [Caldilineaceae bacterium]
MLCSHALNEIEDVCDDVVILRDGQIIAQGTVMDIIQRAQRNVIRIHVADVSVLAAKEVLETMNRITNVTPTSQGWLLVELAKDVEQGGDSGNN